MKCSHSGTASWAWSSESVLVSSVGVPVLSRYQLWQPPVPQTESFAFSRIAWSQARLGSSRGVRVIPFPAIRSIS